METSLFGQHLKDWRKLRGLTQARLATRARYALSTIRKLESGQLRPSHHVAESLATALDLTADDRDAFLHLANGHPPPPAVPVAASPVQLDPLLPPAPLPIPLTSLIGRDGEVAQLRTILVRASARLLTVTGPSGIGKTRLALAVAEVLHDEFPDGIYFVGLAAVSHPDQVVATIADTIGVLDAGSQSQAERLIQTLRPKRALLIVDNFEHLLPAAPALGELLLACPSIKVLVTSQSLLGVYGEHAFAVPPLALPDTVQQNDEAGLLKHGATTLFYERAVAIQPTFTLSPANALAVAQICLHLEGIPLAIELAAAQVRLLPPQAILARLTSRLNFLTGGPTNVPARHQTLRNAIAWSYSLLTPMEQLVFARLSIFPVPWTVEAAESVCEVDPAASLRVTEHIRSLLDKSLIQQYQVHEDERRFGMLETIREYAQDRLAERGEYATVRMKYAQYCLNLAELAAPKLTGSDQTRWLDRLEREHDHLRAALQAYLEDGQPHEYVRLCTLLARFWWIRGHLTEGRRWLDVALAQYTHGQLQLRATALYWSGILAIYQGDQDAAALAIGAGLELYRMEGDIRGTGFALNAQGLLANRQGNHERARQRYEDSLQLFRELNDRERIAALLNNLGYTLLLEGNLARASLVLTESLQMAREQDDKQGIAFALTNLGLVALQGGAFMEAATRLQESLPLFVALGDARNSAECMEALAQVAMAGEDTELAVHLLAAATTLRDVTGAPLSKREQAQHDAIVSGARATMGEGPFAAAWEVGRTRSPEDLLAALSTIVLQHPADTREGQNSALGSHADVPSLTRREVEVLRLLASGLTDAQIARKLMISTRTVNTHINAMYAKLRIHSRSAATRYAVDHGLV